MELELGRIVVQETSQRVKELGDCLREEGVLLGERVGEGEEIREGASLSEVMQRSRQYRSMV